MITVAIIEEDTRAATRIKELLTTYSFQKNMDFRTLWFSTEGSLRKLIDFAQDIHIALVSLSMGKGLDAGKALYTENPDCRILYYSNISCDLEELLPSRPIAFFLWKENEQLLLNKFDAVFSEVLHANAMFCYQTRRRILLIPERNIVYFQSNLKNVEIHKVKGSIETILSKLSTLEEKISGRFVRIHQSFIVNADYVRSIHLDRHMVTLMNGEELPLSEARCQKAVSRLREWSEKMHI